MISIVISVSAVCSDGREITLAIHAVRRLDATCDCAGNRSPPCLANSAPSPDNALVSTSPGEPSPSDLGLPEHSPLTIEGRIEQASMLASHEMRARKGLERTAWRSDWAPGMVQILAALVVVIAVAVVLSLFA
jgi:hypothetical protein